MRMRALDNAGAYAGRAPFQLGKPIVRLLALSDQFGFLSYNFSHLNKTVKKQFVDRPSTNELRNRNSNGSSCFLFKMDRLALHQRNLIRSTNSYLIRERKHIRQW